MFVSIFLTVLIGFLSVFFFYDFQTINSQVETIPSTIQNLSVKITSPVDGKNIPSGELTISGISSDTQDKNCIVFVDWNDMKPFQKVRAAGPGGIDDFSEWIFTFDSRYHEIVTGNNELTAKITCLDGDKPLTKWNSINLTGYKNSLFSPNIDKNKTSAESSFNQPSLKTILPGSNQNTTITADEQNKTSSQLTNVSDTGVEMVIPNESSDNTTDSIPANLTNSKSNQPSLGNPRIDLDEQPDRTVDEQYDNQTIVSPADNQTIVSPADNQTIVSPADNQTIVSPADNQTIVSPADNQTIVSPADNQTIVSPADNQTIVSPADNQTIVSPADNQTIVSPADNQTIVSPADNQTIVSPADNQTIVSPADNQLDGSVVDQLR